MTDWIELRDIQLSCVIGILEEERDRRQPLVLDLAVGLDLEAAAGGDLRATFDYGAFLREVQFLVEEGAWGLVESVAALVVRHVLRPGGGGRGGPRIERARVRVTKPEALGGAAVPAVEIEREAEWLHLEPRAAAPGVALTVLLETPEATAYAVELETDASWSPPEGAALLVTAGTLRYGDRTLEVGQRLRIVSEIHASLAPTRVLAVARAGS